MGLSKMDEQVSCFCHVCDKSSTPFTLVNLSAVNIGLGARYQIFKTKPFTFSLDAIGSYSLLTTESGIEYFGYSIYPVVAYQVRNDLSINLKYGYEESFNDYQKKEKSLEIAINYRLK